MVPTSRALRLVTVAALFPVLLLFVPTAWVVVLLVDGLVVVWLLADALVGRPRQRGLTVHVHVPKTWSRGHREVLRLEFDHTGREDRTVRLRLDVPRSMEVLDVPDTLTLAAGRRTTLEGRIRARQRGSFTLRGVHLAALSTSGFWEMRWLCGEPCTIRVYPNLRQLSEYSLLARSDRLALMGVRHTKRVGGETEFERLRDHRTGDAMRAVDWKSTARRERLTVRDYQVSQSQNLILMLDAGRAMGSHQGEDDTVSHTLFDHAVDAALMLSHVALRRGDRVGVVAYADKLLRYVPPRGGPRHVNAVIHALHDVHPRRVESRHDVAFLALQARERKRTLVVLITNVLDDVHSAILERHLTAIHGRHLPMALFFRDPEVHAPLRVAPENAEQLALAGAAADLVLRRRSAIDALSARGVLAMDVEPEQMAAEAVNRYLRIKAQNLL